MSTIREGTITVAELIKQLQQLPQDLPVQAEGCDCYGEAKGARYVEAEVFYGASQEAYVLIERV